MRRRITAGAAAADAAVAAAGATPAAAKSGADTWHVDAGASGAETGTRTDPFSALEAAEEASSPGDRIVVLRSAVPLAAGIVLKRRQRLIGAGPAVTRAGAGRRVAAIDGSAGGDGDSITLADDTVVRNLRITGAGRGAIYGQNVTGAKVVGNDVSGHNTACVEGFHIPSFNVPLTVHGVGIPIGEGLENGWAGIMLDADSGRNRIVIRGNSVHDGECGDGIDVRAMGTARVRAKIKANAIARLRESSEFQSLLAIGLQSADTARLTATVDRNTQTDLGNEGADSEGVFINPTGPSRIDATVTRNEYRNDDHLGGFSANGLEFVSMGDGSTGIVRVADSSFTGTPGDVLEQLALGTNAYLSLELDNVLAADSSGFGGSGFGNTIVIPGNNGDCLVAASGGAGNAIRTRIADSTLANCANNGITFGSAVANGSGATSLLDFAMTGSRVTANQGANLRVGNVSALDRLLVEVDRSDLSASEGATGTGLANVSFEQLGTTENTQIDLGGGSLDSAGGNCLQGGNLAAELVGYAVSARGNWWGSPAGPGPGRVLSLGGSLDAGQPLASAPACGPG